MSTLADRVITIAPDRQGGDLRGVGSAPQQVLDLSTCVNRYGPPPAVRTALARFDPQTLRAHPFDAESTFVAAYAAYCGAARGEFVGGRGITEFLGILARTFPVRDCAVVTPDYTDTIRLFPRHLDPGRGDRGDAGARLECVRTAMAHHRLVILSNPNNPFGIHLPRTALLDICRRYPSATLVVDEAYIDFTTQRSRSLVGCELDNVVVLQAPNKPFGIAGVRTGVLWTRNDALRATVRASLPNWPIAQVDSVLAIAALGATDWARSTLMRSLRDAEVMADVLAERFGDDVVTADVAVHYRFVHHRDPFALKQWFSTQSIAVRALSGDDRGRPSGIRLVTPTDEEMPRLVAAVRRIPAELTRSPR